MTKLTKLLAALAMAGAFAIGCGNKQDPETKDDRAGHQPNQPAEAKPADHQAAPAAPATPAHGDFPAECMEYKALIDKLADCQKLPATTRDGLRQSFQQSWGAWDKLADKQAIVATCKSNAETLKTAAAAACSW